MLLPTSLIAHPDDMCVLCSRWCRIQFIKLISFSIACYRGAAAPAMTGRTASVRLGIDLSLDVPLWIDVFMVQVPRSRSHAYAAKPLTPAAIPLSLTRTRPHNISLTSRVNRA